MAKSGDQAFIKLCPAVEGNLVYINHEKFVQLFSVSHILISGVNWRKNLHYINSFTNFIKILFSDELFFFKKKKLMLISCTQPSWITSHICNVPPESNQSVNMWPVQCLNWSEVRPKWALIWCWREERPTVHRTQNWNIEKPLGPHPGWCLKGLNGGKECSAWASSSGHVPPLATSSSQLLKRSRVDRDQRQLLLWRERAVF